MTDRPVVHCVIARILDADDPEGFGRTQIVTLDVAWCALQTGAWYAIGPDPADMAALAAWERECGQQQPFNHPRMP